MDESYSFPYTRVGNIVLCPWLQLEVTGPNGKAKTIRGIVDSGADISVLPFDYALILGYDLGALTEIPNVEGGSNCKIEAYQSPQHCTATVVEIPDHGFTLEPMFLKDTTKILWGQADFMAKFDVLFMKSQDRFDLYPN